MRDKPSAIRRVHWICGVAFLTLAASASEVPLSAQNPVKKPWQYTDEERLAMRFEVASMQARLESAIADEAVNEGELRDIVEGSKNPELFLPWELYDHVLTTAFTTNLDARAQFRERYQLTLEKLGFGSDFWPRIERLAKPLFALRNDLRELAKELSSAGVSRKAEVERALHEGGQASCQLKIEIFEQTRGELGRDKFDRFLYEAAAPGLSISALDSSATWEHLRFLAGGCQ